MTTKELRVEWCKKKGFNYIDFDTLREAEEYILFLESKLEALNIADVGKCVFCNNPPYKEGASYCQEHMSEDDWS